MSCRSRSTPWMPAGAADGEPGVVERHLAAHLGQDVAQGVAGLGRARGPVADGDAAARRRGQRQERRGVGEVGLDRLVEGRDRPGRDGPAVGVGVVDVDAAGAEHRDRHLDVGERGHRLAVVADVDAGVVARAGQQQRRDELRRRAGVDHDRAAAHRRRCRARRRAANRGRRRRCPRRGRPAPSAPRRSGAGACAGRRRRRWCRSTARPPAGRTASPCRPGRSRRRRPRSSEPGVIRQSSPLVCDPDAHRGQPGGHQQRVARPQRTAYDARAVGERREDQRPVGQRLAAGQRDDRARRERSGEAPATGPRERSRAITLSVSGGPPACVIS